MKYAIVFLTIILAAAICHGQSIYEDTSIIAHWQFDENSGQTISDSTGNSNHLWRGINDTTLKDASWFSPGFSNSSIYCFAVTSADPCGLVSSGTTGYDALNINADNSYTIAGWVKLQYPNNGQAMLFSKMELSGSYRGWSVGIRDLTTGDEPGKLEFLLRSVNATPGRLWVRSMDPITEYVSNSGWVHIGITYNGNRDVSGVKFYINGNQVYAKSSINALSAGMDTICSSPFNICGRNNAASYTATLPGGYSTYVDELAMWHRSFSPLEMQQCVNESLKVVSTPSGGSTIVFEQGTTSDTINFSVNGEPTAPVTVTIDANSHFNFGSGANSVHSVVLNASNSYSATVTATAVALTELTTQRYFNVPVSVTSGDTNYNGSYVLPLRVAYIDAEAPAFIVDPEQVSVHEEGLTSQNYTIRLSSAPTSDVTITPSYDANELTVTPASRVFTTANYATVQTFTVTAKENLVTLPSQSTVVLAITNTATSADSKYNYLTVLLPQVIKYHNDCIGPFLTSDLNHDCKVDFDDLAIMTGNWLECTLQNVEGCVW
ncbi:MAG: hypothetical protein A2Y10_12925 [Planctomycetes bacterium GWF2_41_51]|nr:MAG: hypothetical protein A2Y10_12925 [Planctomycetes bacterium GWF2_41_51]HBG28224.1 hypothetical protein [Phycisphaerales bacterium]